MNRYKNQIIKLTRFGGEIIKSNFYESTLPYRLTFAITDRCQAKCNICNIWQKKPENELSLQEIDTIFSKAGIFSWINLTGGEIFQRKDALQIIETIISKNRNLYLLNFPTNGFQTETIVDAVKTILYKTELPKLIVSVSLDGTEEMHDKIRGVPHFWENALTTFKLLKKERSSRFSLYLGHTIQKKNIGIFDLMLKEAKKIIPELSAADFHLNLAHHSTHYYNNSNNDIIPINETAIREITSLRKRIKRKRLDPINFIEKKYQTTLTKYLKTGNSGYTCQSGAVSCFISPKGILYPCSMFNSPIGSLRDYDLDFIKLWKSIKRKELREIIKKERCPGCWTPCEAYQTILANILIPEKRWI